MTWFSTDDLAGLADGEVPVADSLTLDQPHHGVAVADRLGNLAHTVGDADTRTGIRS